MRHVFIAPVLIFLLLMVLPFTLTAQKNHLGRFLIDVEQNGEAWYVYPPTGRRYFLGRPHDAFTIMKDLGQGITNTDLALIPTSNDNFAVASGLAQYVEGMILIQVESKGEAWYVNPTDHKRYFLGDETQAFDIMQRLALGARTQDIISIPEARITLSSQINGVPFTAQSPFAEWDDLRQQEGCEEASVIMAMHWVQNRPLLPDLAKQEILEMAEYQNNRWGEFVDTSAQDTADRLLSGYYNYENYEVIKNASVDNILLSLEAGHIVLAPFDGKALDNPFFENNGPDRHMILIHGYDAKTDEFITHEPGTRRGENYRYSYNLLQSALRDYPSGRYVPITSNKTDIVVVFKDE